MAVLLARPTIYKGIRMRSRKEAEMAAFLDENGLEWEYEPVCYADVNGQYLPDFRVLASDGRLAYLEVKGAEPDVSAVQRRMEIVWSSEPDAVLMLYIAQSESSYCADPLCDDGQWTRGA